MILCPKHCKHHTAGPLLTGSWLSFSLCIETDLYMDPVQPATQLDNRWSCGKYRRSHDDRNQCI